MTTIIIPTAFYIAFPFVTASVGVIITVARKTWKWWKYRVIERQARHLLRAFDNAPEDLDEVIDTYREADGAVVFDEETNDVVVVPARRIRRRQERLVVISHALADVAYLKFGFRPDTEAWRSITRKYMLDEMSGFADLRTKDKSKVLDLALPLSFIPTLELQDMELLATTSTFKKRLMRLRSLGWWHRVMPWVRPRVDIV